MRISDWSSDVCSSDLRSRVGCEVNYMLDAKPESSYIRGMNKLPLQKRVQILSMLVEGSSMRSIRRITGVSINTVNNLLVDAVQACATYPAEAIREAPATRRQREKIRSISYTKYK